jgi:hypothetical protein
LPPFFKISRSFLIDSLVGSNFNARSYSYTASVTLLILARAFPLLTATLISIYRIRFFSSAVNFSSNRFLKFLMSLIASLHSLTTLSFLLRAKRQAILFTYTPILSKVVAFRVILRHFSYNSSASKNFF